MQSVERWEIFELVASGPSDGNPFLDVELTAEFVKGSVSVRVDGFYDGEGSYRIRFMPQSEGTWRYATRSSAAVLDGITGEFACTQPGADQHGPVRVSSASRFAYEDGSRYQPVGTTCYAWIHQGEALENETLQALESSPFNKLRMCVFPKHYSFNQNEPDLFPFEARSTNDQAYSWDFDRFDAAFFGHLERRVGELKRLGIEADIILFHPYDRWGFASMDPEVDDRYLRYVVARLASYSNVWWSLANEYDLMEGKSASDWDRFFKIIQQRDPFAHLRSIHNCRPFYDHRRSWVTHCSVQHHDLARVAEWIDQFGKPVVVDECGYEGDIPHDWGNLTAEELNNRFWTGFALGGYVGHGETYVHPEDLLWWSKGGTLRGQSPARIAFLRYIFDAAPAGGYATLRGDEQPPGERLALGPARAYLVYHGIRQPRYKSYRLPESVRYHAEIIDTWEMSIVRTERDLSGRCTLDLPAKPYIAVRFTAAE